VFAFYVNTVAQPDPQSLREVRQVLLHSVIVSSLGHKGICLVERPVVLAAFAPAWLAEAAIPVVAYLGRSWGHLAQANSRSSV